LTQVISHEDFEMALLTELSALVNCIQEVQSIPDDWAMCHSLFQIVCHVS